MPLNRQEFHNQVAQNKKLEMPDEFVYDHDLDEQGLFYWLGSMGKRKLWANPH